MRRPLLVAAAALALLASTLLPLSTLTVPAWALSSRVEQALANMFNAAGDLVRLIWKPLDTAPPLSRPGKCVMYVDSTYTVRLSCNGGAYGFVGIATFDVTTFGAKADGATDDTQAIRDAIWAACQSTGPATVYFPGTANYYKITDRLPVLSISTSGYPTGASPTNMISGCESAGVPLPCCAARNVGYCGVEPYKCDGITFEGNGPRSRIVQTFTDTTTASRPVFDIRGAKGLTFRNLALENEGAKITFGSGSSNSTVDHTTKVLEYRAGFYLAEGVDDIVLDNVTFRNFSADVKARGYVDGVRRTYNFTARHIRSEGTTFGMLGFDGQSGFTLEDYQASYDSEETNAPHAVYLAVSGTTRATATQRIQNVVINDVVCGDWSGEGIGCRDAPNQGSCLSLRDVDHLAVSNVLSDGCLGPGEFDNVTFGVATNIVATGANGCWGFNAGTTDSSLVNFRCSVGEIINPANCTGSGTPAACCTSAGNGATCNNGAIIKLDWGSSNQVDHVKRVRIADGELHATVHSATYGAINIFAGGGTADDITIDNVRVYNDKGGSAVVWNALRVENAGLRNSATRLIQYPKDTSSRPVRFTVSLGTEWFLDLPDYPGFDDSTLPDINVVQRGSRVLCHNCSETVTTGVCSTGWTNSNIVAVSDGQNWICGDGVLPATPTPTATATRTATPTVTPTAATPTPTATVTPTLSTPLPTP